MIKRSLKALTSRLRRNRLILFGGITAAALLGGAITAHSLTGDLAIAEAVEGHAIDDHMDQATLNAALGQPAPNDAFTLAFKQGNELFQTVFNGADGIGGKVHAGERFSQVPRADQTDPGEWFTHIPARATGPNAQSCTGCHHLGEGPDQHNADDGAGTVAENASRDPLRHGLLAEFIQRNSPHTFGIGAIQRLAEEMTADLLAIRNGAGCNCTSTSTSTASCTARTRTLTSKGVNFGTATISRASGATACTVSVSVPSGGVKRVDNDLIVKPLQWKGANAFIRDFARGAGHN